MRSVFENRTDSLKVLYTGRFSRVNEEHCPNLISNRSCVSSVQLSSRWYLCAWKSPYALHPVSLRSFPNVAFEMVPMFVRLTMALSRPFKEDRLALPLSTPLSTPLSLALCLQVVSQASQHFRSSEKQGTCEGCFARQSTSVSIAVRLKRLMASVSTCPFQIQHAVYTI